MEAIRYQKSVISTGWYEGHADGKAEGLAEGEKLKQLEIARKMKDKGFSIDNICDLTGLTLMDIEKL